MKRCPKCKNVYEDDVRYCLDDGAALVKEAFVLPSKAGDSEAETTICHDPIIVDLSAENLLSEPIIYQNPPVEMMIIEKPVKRKSPAFFLFSDLFSAAVWF